MWGSWTSAGWISLAILSRGLTLQRTAWARGGGAVVAGQSGLPAAPHPSVLTNLAPCEGSRLSC